jgi:putative isomerase
MVGNTMNAYAVDLNALWSMDAEYLALIAGALGLKEDAALFRTEQKEMNRRINETLWNEKLGMYCSRLWSEDGKPGAFLTRFTPMNFYPLICGTPDATRAARVMKVLTDPAMFWGQWKIPTLAYNDPMWPQQGYWRGNVWAPVNYLVFQGLKHYASPEQLQELARSSVELFMRNWDRRRVCGENYLSTTGEQSSDPHYTWGALLCLVGVETVVDVNNDGKIVTGQGLPGNLELRNIPLGGKLFRVEVKGGQAVVKRMKSAP